MEDAVTILGVKGGPAIRPGSNMPTSILLQVAGQTILVDSGLGAARGVCDQGVALPDIDTIFITHLHSDHYLELGPLIHTAWVAGRRTPLVIYGPSGLSRYWTGFLTSMQDDISLRIADEGRVDLAGLVTCKTIADGDAIALADVTVRVMRNDHPPIEESFALRFEWDARAVVLSGDTAFIPDMIEFARDADLLVHEAMLVDGVDVLMRRMTNGDARLKQHILRSHTSAQDVGRIATDAGVKQLALNHFVPDGFAEFTDSHWTDAVATTWSGPLVLARDGTRLVIS